MAQSRTLAILHAAIHDALNAIEPRFQAYSPGLGRANGASAEAAVAAAARDVLVTLLPEQAALVESEYAPGACSDSRWARQERRRCPRPSLRPCEHHSPARGRRRQSRATVPAPHRAWRVSIHAPVQLRRAAGMGTSHAVCHRHSRAYGCRAAGSFQFEVRARPGAGEGDRRHQQHDPDSGAIRDCAVLVRRLAARVEPNREHCGAAAKARSLVSGTSICPGQLRHGRWIHCGVRSEVSVQILAPRDRYPRCCAE